ncbi:branched-chain amino acid ABC transporter permease [Actinomadura parmotrematis]|uniref:Branched-chain amino acid ABC transporter permease n=1 Tax=Actinomadura parmotrematis TaxID=2864039 RepID=A0ABS7FWM4_9ACTN|nr:branched-chain amino acid ABC transporter permease [Actinomadura parmotrematis]MBW8484828.1 branched-chain amino acid ABC transporter permease [Actinomadura parmotrematis]
MNARTTTRTLARRGAPLLLALVLLAVPYSTLDVPVLLPGPLNSPGTLQLIAVCLLFAGFALSYDLLFGRTGLLSFGHALYIAVGSYTTNIAVTRGGWSLGAALALTAAVGLVLPAVIGAVALRVNGIAFAMVTLAVAQLGSIIVLSDPDGRTGGEEGLALGGAGVPAFLSGVANTVNLYWLALGYAALVALAIAWSVASEPGRVWAAIRENERRVTVLGLPVLRFRLMAYVLASLLATLGGAVHLLVMGGSTPQITTSDFTLGLLVMVVLGGAGSRWGAILGGVLYTFLDHRLAALGTSGAVADLPAVLRAPLSEPLFLLGALFVLAVYFLPGGLAGLAGRLRPARDGAP